ncbi:hypothetical protein [Aquimarina algiphila]|uniref:hypothetical protein n=1 Tax=Aquimarina algiphila TaxID=2047982 RepID=UPI0024918BF5|nr:hypothetical protein [Aquimarina algiphila]
MKKLFLNFLTILSGIIFLIGCSNDDDSGTVEEPITFADMESDWVRLTLMSEGKLEVMQADSGEMKYNLDTPLTEDARYYTSNSGRYLTVIDRAGGIVRFFDSGIVNHEDHGHEYQAKWANVELNTVLPTHYAGSKGHIVIFNDGDGSISYINEAQLEIPSYQPETFTFTNTVAHHGAGFRLTNGMFAVTFQSETPPEGYEWGPQMVKYISSEGEVIDDNGGVEVSGIHGDAVNGDYGVFGSTDGIILVDTDSNINLIANAEGLNAESGNWLGTVKGHDNSNLFFGRSRNLGVFKIDPLAKSLESIYLGEDVANTMFSFDGAYFLVHTNENKIIVFDAQNGNEITQRNIEIANIPELSSKREDSEIQILQKMEEPSPVLVCSNKFLYVLAPNRTQIKVLKIENLSHVHTIELNSPVLSMMKNGFSLEGDQNPDYEH